MKAAMNKFKVIRKLECPSAAWTYAVIVALEIPFAPPPASSVCRYLIRCRSRGEGTDLAAQVEFSVSV